MNQLQLNRCFYWFIEGGVIIVSVSILSAVSINLLHYTVQTFGIVCACLFYLVVKANYTLPKNNLLSAIGVAFGLSGILLLLATSLQVYFQTSAEAANLSLYQFDTLQRLAGCILLLFSLLFNKFLTKLNFILVPIAFAFGLLMFAIAFGIHSFDYLSNRFIDFPVLILMLANSIIFYHYSKGIPYLVTSQIALSVVLSGISTGMFLLPFHDETRNFLLQTIFMTLSWYLLLRSIIILQRWAPGQFFYASHSDSIHKVQKRIHELDILNTNFTTLLSEHDSTHLSETILSQAISLFQANGGELGLLDTKRNEIVIVASKNSFSNKGDRTLSGVGILGITISRKEPIIIHHGSYALTNDNLRNRREFMSVPLSIDSTTIGALMVLRESEAHQFTISERNFMQIFAAQAAVTLRNIRLLEDAQKRAETDSLTGLANHHHFFDLAATEFNRSIRYHHSLTALMFDIDHFKEVNDTYGHGFGDKVLVAIANLCMQLFRSIDIVGRYGGEEFAVLFPETPLYIAKEIAERLRRSVASLIISHDNSSLSVTISIGIASLKNNCKSVDVLIEQADEALYKAKRNGRNKIVVWNENVHDAFVRKQKVVSFHRKIRSHQKKTRNSRV